MIPAELGDALRGVGEFLGRPDAGPDWGEVMEEEDEVDRGVRVDGLGAGDLVVIGVGEALGGVEVLVGDLDQALVLLGDPDPAQGRRGLREQGVDDPR
jgi:hypothetical protein